MVVPKSKNSTSYFYKTVHKPYQMTDKQKKLFEEQMRNTFMEDIDLLNQISAGNTWSEQKLMSRRIRALSKLKKFWIA